MEITITVAAALTLCTAIAAIAMAWGRRESRFEHLEKGHDGLKAESAKHVRETRRKLHEIVNAHAHIQVRVAVLEERTPGVPRRVAVDLTPVPIDPEDPDPF